MNIAMQWELTGVLIAAVQCDVEKCNCRVTSGSCADQCILKAVQIRCDPRVCPCGDDCQNKPFDIIEKPATKPIMTDDK